MNVHEYTVNLSEPGLRSIIRPKTDDGNNGTLKRPAPLNSHNLHLTITVRVEAPDISSNMDHGAPLTAQNFMLPNAVLPSLWLLQDDRKQPLREKKQDKPPGDFLEKFPKPKKWIKLIRTPKKIKLISIVPA